MKWTCEQPKPLLEELKIRLPEASTTTLRKGLVNGRVSLNGEIVKKNLSLNKGDLCTWGEKAKFVDEISILYEDDHIVVVDKPEGLLSVATARQTVHTLLYKLKGRYTNIWPVHRLDRETSGLLVFARTQLTYRSLSQQFRDHSITREYGAIVIGNPPQKGIWKHHLVEDGNLKMHVAKEGELAETHFKVIGRKEEKCLVRFSLHTGKKNQIRVQASHMGYPILGDRKYGNREIKAPRMFLHACTLRFFHPIRKKKMSFFSSIPFSVR